MIKKELIHNMRFRDYRLAFLSKGSMRTSKWNKTVKINNANNIRAKCITGIQKSITYSRYTEFNVFYANEQLWIDCDWSMQRMQIFPAVDIGIGRMNVKACDMLKHATSGM